MSWEEQSKAWIRCGLDWAWFVLFLCRCPRASKRLSRSGLDEVRARSASLITVLRVIDVLVRRSLLLTVGIDSVFEFRNALWPRGEGSG